MQEAEGAHTMKAFWEDMLEEAAQELVRCKAHEASSCFVGAAIGEGDMLGVDGEDGFVGEGRARSVAAEVFEDLVCALHGGFGEGDPALAEEVIWKRECWEGGAGAAHEGGSEDVRERSDRDEEVFVTHGREGGCAGGGESAARDEHVNVGMPLEGARPGVQDAEGADLRGAEELRVFREHCEGLEGCAKERAEERLLMSADETTQGIRHSKDKVEVGRWQERRALLVEPTLSRVRAAARACAISARVIEVVLDTAGSAHGDVPTERRSTAITNGMECGSVTRQHRITEPRQIGGSMPLRDIA